MISFHFHQKLCNSKSTKDGELKFSMQKYLEKMWLETKFQPFRLRNDKDKGGRIDVHGAGMTCTPLYVVS